MKVKVLGIGVVGMVMATGLAMAAGPSQKTTESHVQLTVAQKAPHGKYLTDSQGHALYMFSTDTPGQSSSCADACAQAWPPLTLSGTAASAGPGINQTMVGSIQRQDGATQVTYNGWPLYAFVQDKGPGQVNGQSKHGFGGDWALMSPTGEPVIGDQKASTEGGKKPY